MQIAVVVIVAESSSSTLEKKGLATDFRSIRSVVVSQASDIRARIHSGSKSTPATSIVSELIRTAAPRQQS